MAGSDCRSLDADVADLPSVLPSPDPGLPPPCHRLSTLHCFRWEKLPGFDSVCLAHMHAVGMKLIGRASD